MGDVQKYGQHKNVWGNIQMYGGHADIWGDVGGVQTYRECTDVWGCTNVWGM